MKLLCAEYNEAGEVAYNVIGDNALLRNNDDFYIPAFATELSCTTGCVTDWEDREARGRAFCRTVL